MRLKLWIFVSWPWSKLSPIHVEPGVKLLQLDRRKLAQTEVLKLFRGHHLINIDLLNGAVVFLRWSWHGSMLRAPAKHVKKIVLQCKSLVRFSDQRTPFVAVT